MRPLLVVAALLIVGCTDLNPECDAVILACYAKHPDAWEKECLAKIDMAQRPDMAPIKNGIGWPCESNNDCTVPWTWPGDDMFPRTTFDLFCYDTQGPLGKKCCTVVPENLARQGLGSNCAP